MTEYIQFELIKTYDELAINPQFYWINQYGLTVSPYLDSRAEAEKWLKDTIISLEKRKGEVK